MPRLALCWLAFFGLPPGLLHAEPMRVDAEYAIYAGGLRALGLAFQAERDDSAYRVEVIMQTQGLIDFLVRFAETASTSGRATASGLAPRQHQAASDGRLGSRSVRIVWDTAHRPEAVAVPDAEADDRDVPPAALIAGVPDPLTAILARLSSARPCAGEQPIFDGRRRYNLIFTLAGRETLAPSRYSAFAGEALRCEFRMHRLGGFQRHDEAENREEDRIVTTVWLTPVQIGVADGNPETLYLPVRLQRESKWGTALGHLTRAEINGTMRFQQIVEAR